MENKNNDYSNIDEVIKEIENKASDIHADMEIDKKKQLDRYDDAGDILYNQVSMIEKQLLEVLPKVMFKRNDKTINEDEWNNFQNNARVYAMYRRDNEAIDHYKWLNESTLDDTTFRVDPCFIPVPNLNSEIGPDLINRYYKNNIGIIPELFSFMDKYYEETKQPFTPNMINNLFRCWSDICYNFIGINSFALIDSIVNTIMDYKIMHSQVDHKITEYDKFTDYLEYYNAGVTDIETDDGPIDLNSMFNDNTENDKTGEGSETPAWENIPGQMMFGVGTIGDD